MREAMSPISQRCRPYKSLFSNAALSTKAHKNATPEGQRDAETHGAPKRAKGIGGMCLDPFHCFAPQSATGHRKMAEYDVKNLVYPNFRTCAAVGTAKAKTRGEEKLDKERQRALKRTTFWLWAASFCQRTLV